jgi:hypothetical protein
MSELMSEQNLCKVGYSICPDKFCEADRPNRNTYCISIWDIKGFELNIQIWIASLMGGIKFYENFDRLDIHVSRRDYNVIAVSVCDKLGNKYIISRAPENKIDRIVQRGYGNGGYIIWNIDDSVNLFILDSFNSLVIWEQVVRSHFPEV